MCGHKRGKGFGNKLAVVGMLLALVAPLAMAQIGEGAAPAQASGAAQTSCPLPWVWFDLGANTLIDTETHDFQQIQYMPGAYEYLRELRSKGYHLGLLVNIPEEWGKTQEEKFKTTREVIAAAWTDPRPMDWEIFDLGVTFPPTDAERKPAPFLFDQALARANAEGCDAVYQTTLPDEVVAANKSGMVGISLGTQTYDGLRYYPEARLKERDFSLLKP